MDNNSSYEEVVKGMRDKAVEFESALASVMQTNNELVEKASEALTGIAKLIGNVRQNSNKCNVCYTREAARVCVPCGHTFCSSCAGRAERSRCHACRAHVDSTMRVYI